MKNKQINLLIFIFLIIIFSSIVNAKDHYSYEHSYEMKHSGRIEWRDYSPETFKEAISENKPIFLMLTAPSWCYWCHVYTSDDYIYHPDIYPLLNEKFIPIYVDADKRQDLTRKYLEGGWPSTTIMTPGRERLMGYSGAISLENMIVNFQKVISQVNSVDDAIIKKIFYDYKKTGQTIPTNVQLEYIISNYANSILYSYDSKYGGFGNGQKFPRGRTLDFSLELYENSGDEKWINLVINTLENQYTNISKIKNDYNLFDPVEGGFHRYGTRRDWTPPHYEKMLYDNSKLLKTYYHLLQLRPNHLIANEVVNKNLKFIGKNWYDSNNGGFFGNSDVHGEDGYYGDVIRSENKPRVEKTKYTDWNSEAIISYLYLWQNSNDKIYLKMAENSLNFFIENMVNENGVYHYVKENGEKGIQGNLLDNSYFLLSLIEGYESTNNKIYLKFSRKIADYSLNNLYDWNNGGFFERNSVDIKQYAPGEHISLTKPAEENGIISYAFLKLYTITKDPHYLNAGIKTIGNNLQNIGNLESIYYYAKSSQLILDHSLIDDFKNLNEKITKIDSENKNNFWLKKLLLNDEFVISEDGLNNLDSPILILIFVAFLAGIISFASPCTLPIIPAYMAYSFKDSKHRIKSMTFFFFLGLILIFTLLGMSSTLLGKFLKSHITIFSQLAGILILIFGILIILEKGFKGIEIKNSNPKTYLGAFLFGSAFGVSWTPCVGPILVAILLMASTTNSIITGGLLLFIYGIGLALPLILFSLYVDKLNKKNKVWRILKGCDIIFIFDKKEFNIHSNSLISGVLFILMGYLIFSGNLYSFNQYISASALQNWTIGIENWILSILN